MYVEMGKVTYQILHYDHNNLEVPYKRNVNVSQAKRAKGYGPHGQVAWRVRAVPLITAEEIQD